MYLPVCGQLPLYLLKNKRKRNGAFTLWSPLGRRTQSRSLRRVGERCRNQRSRREKAALLSGFIPHCGAGSALSQECPETYGENASSAFSGCSALLQYRAITKKLNTALSGSAQALFISGIN